jgi:general secretion pathway protein G
MHTSRIRHARAFSLLELTLVLAIIGVLMAITAVSIFGRGEAAKIKATWASMQTIKNAIEQYQLNNSALPPGVAALSAGKTPYLDASKPLADGWKEPFIYAAPGQNAKPYDLFSKGPNKTFENGGGDDISVWVEPKE